jgi:hypothetical protein
MQSEFSVEKRWLQRIEEAVCPTLSSVEPQFKGRKVKGTARVTT